MNIFETVSEVKELFNLSDNDINSIINENFDFSRFTYINDLVLNNYFNDETFKLEVFVVIKKLQSKYSYKVFNKILKNIIDIKICRDIINNLDLLYKQAIKYNLI